MANPEHLKILQEGRDVWHAWRDIEPEIIPDLRESDLQEQDFSEMDLSDVDFTGAYMYGVIFIGANLQRAILEFADLRDTRWYAANLEGALLQGANLYEADLSSVNLHNANLFEAGLEYVLFDNTELAGSDFSIATMCGTKFINTDLSVAKGLDSVRHMGPSSIDIDTIYASRGGISETFLRSCGVPNDFITHIPSLVAAIQPIQFYSCFISYSSKDEDFARRLHERMRAAGLRVWFAAEDIKGGQKLHEQIDRAIQVHDRLLLVLSQESMQSEWVMTEIRKARKAEVKEGRRKLFPIRLVDYEDLSEWEGFDDHGKDLAVEVREYFIPDFTHWKSHDDFEAAFDRLLSALKAEV